MNEEFQGEVIDGSCSVEGRVPQTTTWYERMAVRNHEYLLSSVGFWALFAFLGVWKYTHWVLALGVVGIFVLFGVWVHLVTKKAEDHAAAWEHVDRQ